MQVGLHSAMVERRYPLPLALEKAAAFGSDTYEIDIGIGRAGENWAARWRAWQEYKELLRATADNVDIKLSSLCLGVLWQHSLASDDETERRAGVEIVRDCIPLATFLGATALLLPVGQPPGLEAERARANLVDSIRRCLPAAERAGVVLALENVCQRVLYSADDLADVVDAIGSSACGVYYDPGNQSFIGVDPVQELRRLGERVVRVHVKDTVPLTRTVTMPDVPVTGDFNVWQRRTVVTLGTGELDYRAIRDVLAEIGYRNGVILEVPQAADTVDEGCRANLAVATKLFGIM